MTIKQLVPEIPVVYFSPESHRCVCGGARMVLKTRWHTIVTMAVGALRAYETIMVCDRCKAVARPEQLQQLVPHCGRFGFDVIVYIGEALFLRSRNELEIQQELAEKNVHISTRAIRYLGVRFVIYLAIAHKESGPGIRALLQRKGGFILHLDGTCEGDSPHLITTMDEVSGLVLGNIKIPSEKAAAIIPLLKQIRSNYGDPIAAVHDMGAGILDAIAREFPNTPDFICHYHFLRDIGKDLFGSNYDLLRKALKSHGLKAKISRLVKESEVKIQRRAEWRKLLAECKVTTTCTIPENVPPIIIAYLLGVWILDYPSELTGRGFPFDRAHLVFFDRIIFVHNLIRHVHSKPGDFTPVIRLEKLLRGVVSDDRLRRNVEGMREKIAVFEELRQVLRIALPTNTDGLNDDGCEVDMKNIEKSMRAFAHKMDRKLSTSKKLDRT